MSFPIDTTIPNENNDPIDDVPLMRGNFNNTNSYLKVDHVEAGAPGNGYHKQVTYFNVASPGSPVGNTSVGYTALGQASPAVPEGRFVNSIGTFPTTAIRACVLFQSDTSAPINTPLPLLNNINVDKVERTGSDIYRITLTANATTGTDFLVFLLAANGNSSSYTLAANIISGVQVNNSVNMSVLVIQI